MGGAMSNFRLDPAYKGVPERIADFKAKHPEGRLRPVDITRPYWVETIGDKTYIVYAAAAYRDENDIAPGIGCAWEEFPGPTSYTKDSELQNAETSAWGRAIVAALASESKTIASREDVERSRSAPEGPSEEMKAAMDGLVAVINLVPGDEAPELKAYIRESFGGPTDMSLEDIRQASVIAAGWPGTKPAPPVDVAPGEDPF